MHLNLQINFFKSLENPELENGITILENYNSQIDSKTNLKDLIRIEAEMEGIIF